MTATPSSISAAPHLAIESLFRRGRALRAFEVVDGGGGAVAVAEREARADGRQLPPVVAEAREGVGERVLLAAALELVPAVREEAHQSVVGRGRVGAEARLLPAEAVYRAVLPARGLGRGGGGRVGARSRFRVRLFEARAFAAREFYDRAGGG